MQPYFAYGSNMDEAALRSRCPGARFVDIARLPNHRFALMGNGYATVRRAAFEAVHGVLYEVSVADVTPLDLYEDVAHALYVKATVSVQRPDGSTCQALVYIGSDPEAGRSIHPGYMEGIAAAARAFGLPAEYVMSLDALTTLEQAS